MNDDAFLSEMRALKHQVAGVTNITVATVDGMLVATDDERVHAENLAALGAAMLGLARRTVQEVGNGAFRETVTRSDSGYVAVYAIGNEALLVVLADRGLNFARLHLEARRAIERMAAIFSGAGISAG